jgi:hypothetical protein
MDKLYILGNPGDKVKISLVGRAQRVRWGQTISTPEATTP